MMYQHKPVEARQYDATNFAELREWSKGHATNLLLGDWVIQRLDGTFFTLTDSAFERHYNKVPATVVGDPLTPLGEQLAMIEGRLDAIEMVVSRSGLALHVPLVGAMLRKS